MPAHLSIHFIIGISRNYLIYVMNALNQATNETCRREIITMKNSPLFSCKNHPESDHPNPINSHGDALCQRRTPGGWSNGSIFLGALGLATLALFTGLTLSLVNKKESAKSNVDAKLRREPATTTVTGDAPRISKNWGGNP